MKADYSENGIRYHIELNELHARTVDQRSAALKPDPELWSAQEKRAALAMRTDDETEMGRRKQRARRKGPCRIARRR